MLGELDDEIQSGWIRQIYVEQIQPYSQYYHTGMDYAHTVVKFGNIGDSYHRFDLIYGDRIWYYTLTQVSSKNLKHDIKKLESVGEQLDKLNPVTFVYNEDEENNKRFGMIYEETVEVMPEICSKNPQDDRDKSINYIELIPMLLKEIQDLRKRVKELESRL